MNELALKLDHTKASVVPPLEQLSLEDTKGRHFKTVPIIGLSIDTRSIAPPYEVRRVENNVELISSDFNLSVTRERPAIAEIIAGGITFVALLGAIIGLVVQLFLTSTTPILVSTACFGIVLAVLIWTRTKLIWGRHELARRIGRVGEATS